MNNGSENTLLIILALIAVFILLQLRRTLGKKTGYENPEEKTDIYDRHAHKGKAAEKPDARFDEGDNVISLHPDQDEETQKINLGISSSSPFYGAIEAINSYDRSFTLRSFIDGAEQAYGIILTSFWKGDKKTLRSMLSKDVFEQFSSSIDQLEEKKLHWDNMLKDVEIIELENANMTGSMAELTLKFTSHMTLSTKDEEDKIVEGDATHRVQVTDIWTFCRDVRSSDPNWTLVATRNA